LRYRAYLCNLWIHTLVALKEILLMKSRNLSILLASLFVIAGAVFAAGARAEGEVPAPPAIGSTIEDFTLPDVDNKDRSLKSLAGKNGTVLLFIAVQCPVSNAYNERMAKLAEDYQAKGIAVIGINSNVAEDAAAVKAHAAEHKLAFPILKDAGNKIADRLGASVTPEAYFIDANNKLLYHGRIDNARNAAQIETSDLRNALDAALGGKTIEKTEAKAFGCSIKRA
jgi:peroxiredoxin